VARRVTQNLFPSETQALKVDLCWLSIHARTTLLPPGVP
jgi:hypothetical protein